MPRTTFRWLVNSVHCLALLSSIAPVREQVGNHKVSAMLNDALLPGCPYSIRASATEVRALQSVMLLRARSTH